VRALTFFSLVLAIVSLIFLNRSFSASLITALAARTGRSPLNGISLRKSGLSAVPVNDFRPDQYRCRVSAVSTHETDRVG
jgi:hypothetical protein